MLALPAVAVDCEERILKAEAELPPPGHAEVAQLQAHLQMLLQWQTEAEAIASARQLPPALVEHRPALVEHRQQEPAVQDEQQAGCERKTKRQRQHAAGDTAQHDAEHRHQHRSQHLQVHHQQQQQGRQTLIEVNLVDDDEVVLAGPPHEAQQQAQSGAQADPGPRAPQQRPRGDVEGRAEQAPTAEQQQQRRRQHQQHQQQPQRLQPLAVTPQQGAPGDSCVSALAGAAAGTARTRRQHRDGAALRIALTKIPHDERRHITEACKRLGGARTTTDVQR